MASAPAAEYFARSWNIGGQQAATVRPVAIAKPESNRPGKFIAVHVRHEKDGAGEVDLGLKQIAMFSSRAGKRAAPLQVLISWWFAVALLLLRLLPMACGVVDLTLYGGAFDSSSTIAYAEVSGVPLSYIVSQHTCDVSPSAELKIRLGQTPLLQNDFQLSGCVCEVETCAGLCR